MPAATFFWLKARAGWHEVIRQEHTGGDGGPIQLQRVEDTRPPIESYLLEWTARREDDEEPSRSELTDAGI